MRIIASCLVMCLFSVAAGATGLEEYFSNKAFLPIITAATKISNSSTELNTKEAEQKIDDLIKKLSKYGFYDEMKISKQKLELIEKLSKEFESASLKRSIEIKIKLYGLFLDRIVQCLSDLIEQDIKNTNRTLELYGYRLGFKELKSDLQKKKELLEEELKIATPKRIIEIKRELRSSMFSLLQKYYKELDIEPNSVIDSKVLIKETLEQLLESAQQSLENVIKEWNEYLEWGHVEELWKLRKLCTDDEWDSLFTQAANELEKLLKDKGSELYIQHKDELTKIYECLAKYWHLILNRRNYGLSPRHISKEKEQEKKEEEKVENVEVENGEFKYDGESDFDKKFKSEIEELTKHNDIRRVLLKYYETEIKELVREKHAKKTRFLNQLLKRETNPETDPKKLVSLTNSLNDITINSTENKGKGKGSTLKRFFTDPLIFLKGNNFGGKKL